MKSIAISLIVLMLSFTVIDAQAGHRGRHRHHHDRDRTFFSFSFGDPYYGRGAWPYRRNYYRPWPQRAAYHCRRYCWRQGGRWDRMYWFGSGICRCYYPRSGATIRFGF